jgi:hypothetical protein
MRTTTSTWRSFSAIHPPEVASYLRANGWNESRSVPNKLAIWTRKTDAGEFEILLPLKSVRDFTSRIAEVFRTLELAEGRSQLEIIADVLSQRADIVRIASDVAAEDGSISLETGVLFLRAIRDMMFAAACAAVERAAILPKKKPPQAVRYMQSLRLGQTERGSYIFHVISSLHSGSGTGQDAIDLAGAEPFPRAVTVTLARAVSTVGALASGFEWGSVQQRVGGMIEAGVSADLCDALKRMASASSTAVTLRFSWSPILGGAEFLPAKVLLGSGVSHALQETKRFLKEAVAPPAGRVLDRPLDAQRGTEAFELRGYVESLSKLPRAERGKVVVLATIGQTLSPARVNLELPAEAYLQAVEAHGANLAIACTGRLVAGGTHLFLHEVRNFRILLR